MQSVTLKPKRGDWIAMAVGLILLCMGMIFVPALCLPLALGIPLLGCPLVGRKEERVAWIACAVPTVSSLLAGYDAAYAAALLLIGLLPMAITRRIPMPQRPGAKGMLLYISAVAVALTFAAFAAAWTLDGPLWATLPQIVVRRISQARNPSLVLYRLATMGLINVPEGYATDGLVRPLMQAAYNQQMLKSLRLTLEMLIEQTLPALFAQACLLVGLFTSLRLERVSGVVLVVEAKSASEKQTRVIAPPSFRLLAMPKSLRWTAFAMFVGSFALLLSAEPALQVAGRLAFSAAQTLYQLLGAAIVVFLLTQHDPDRRTLAGVAAAALYVLLPQLLLLAGVMDGAMHFRKPRADKPDGT